jgi:hypothetical protein
VVPKSTPIISRCSLLESPLVDAVDALGAGVFWPVELATLGLVLPLEPGAEGEIIDLEDRDALLLDARVVVEPFMVGRWGPSASFESRTQAWRRVAEQAACHGEMERSRVEQSRAAGV